MRACATRYAAMGSRLSSEQMEVVDGGIAPSCGLYSLTKGNKGEQVLKSLCGAECRLPDSMQGQDWKIEHNMSFSKACLVTDMLKVRVTSLFEKARPQVGLATPEHIWSVTLETTLPVSAASSSASAKAAAAPKAPGLIPLPPSGKGGALA